MGDVVIIHMAEFSTPPSALGIQLSESSHFVATLTATTKDRAVIICNRDLSRMLRRGGF